MIARHFTPDKLVDKGIVSRGDSTNYDKGLTLIKVTCDGLKRF